MKIRVLFGLNNAMDTAAKRRRGSSSGCYTTVEKAGALAGGPVGVTRLELAGGNVAVEREVMALGPKIVKQTL